MADFIRVSLVEAEATIRRIEAETDDEVKSGWQGLICNRFIHGLSLGLHDQNEAIEIAKIIKKSFD